jgi:hypothetical protein
LGVGPDSGESCGRKASRGVAGAIEVKGMGPGVLSRRVVDRE